MNENKSVILEKKNKILGISLLDFKTYPRGIRFMFTQKSIHQHQSQALFIIAKKKKNWKQYRYSSIGKWLNKLWHIHIMEWDTTWQ